MRAAVVAFKLRLLFGFGFGTSGSPVAGAASRRIGAAGAAFAARMVDFPRVWTAPLSGARYVAAIFGPVHLGRSLVAAVTSLSTGHWMAALVGPGMAVGLLMVSSQAMASPSCVCCTYSPPTGMCTCDWSPR